MNNVAPLEGIRVLDFTTFMAGPYCTRLMADLGAEVLKIEAPEGDHVRNRPPLRDGHSTYFAQLNCGKKSLCIDLRKDGAREAMLDLARTCDVLVESFRPGVMRRLGLSYEAIREINPKLIYCSISGFGQTGPLAGRSAYAPIVHAFSGFDLANLSYQDGLKRPLNNGLFTADVLAGSLAFGAIQAALVGRGRTGKGDWIDVSLLDAMLGLQVYESQEAQFGSARRRPLYQPLISTDGFVIAAPITQPNFEALARAVGRPEWLRDKRFSTVSAREQNWALLMSELEIWTRDRTSLECEDLLNSAGVPCARYLTTGEAMRTPQIVERETFATISDEAGSFQVANTPFKFKYANVRVRPNVAELGADGRRILGEDLGYSKEKVDKLFGNSTPREANRQ